MSDSLQEANEAVSKPSAGSSNAVIEANALTKAFSEEVIALQGASFKINEGDFISLVGPSGCGKSTLLRLVAGLIEKTSGSVKVRENEVTEPRTDIGMMFQKPVLLEWRTAVENVLLPSELSGKITDDDRNRAIRVTKIEIVKNMEVK